jgi:hypothetical protein
MAALDDAENVLLAAALLDADQARKARERLAALKLPSDYFPQVALDLELASREAILAALSKAWNIPVASPSALNGQDTVWDWESLASYEMCGRNL